MCLSFWISWIPMFQVPKRTQLHMGSRFKQNHVCLESLGRRVDRGLGSSLQPPTFCSVWSQRSTGGKRCWQPTKTPPGFPGPQRLSLMPTRRRWRPHTPAMVRLCLCRCWWGQARVAQLQPVSQEGTLQLRGFRRETQTGRTRFSFSIPRPVSSRGWTPPAACPHTCSFCACVWRQKLPSVQTASRGRGRMTGRLEAAKQEAGKILGTEEAAASSVHPI